ncbi:PH domain-containing protein [Gloeobacter morelensis]|uniref:PH domain-containing protein n=1 Tax=Gloeobacter morelensis TaxID=2907343 RepID=UPI001E3012F9|nr:PH domain-containing protein [Gloeobacter morelensis]
MQTPKFRLFEGETIILTIRPFIWMYIAAGPAVLIAGITGVPLAAAIAPQIFELASSMSVFVVVAGTLLTLWQWLCWHNTIYVLTTHRLAVRHGVLNVFKRNIDLCNIQDVESQLLWGFDFGHVNVETAGNSSNADLRWIENAQSVEEQILEAADARKRKTSWRGGLYALGEDNDD